jgi:transcription-repair coupling factor (superfamily II helicase)
MTKDARRRLQSILTFTELGAGFRLAMRDLEIRGAGNLLGSEQHGYARSVGYELYMKMVEEAIRRMRGEKLPQERKIELNLGMSSFIPDEYVDKDRKLGLYKRLTEMRKIDEVRDFRNELIDRFGQPSQPTKNLLLSERVRILCIERGIERIMKERNGFSIKFSEEVKPDMKKLRGSIKRFSLGFNVKDGLEVFLKSREPKDIVIFLRDFVSTMNH